MNPVAILARIFEITLTPALAAGFIYRFTMKMLETGDLRESLIHAADKTLIPVKVPR